MYLFKERLQYLIDYKKIPQAVLALGLNISDARVSNWLTGKTESPRRLTISKIATFFGCDIEWLATGKGEPFPKRM